MFIEKYTVYELTVEIFVRFKMSLTQTWILRSSVVMGMIVAVVTVLYLTPMPEHHFKSCERPCHELEWPMICRIKLNLEVSHSMGKACEECPSNTTHCSNKHCILADGHKRALLTANRELPGPSIQVCKNDIVVVDVSNKVPGQEFSIHWRGQHMEATPCMDGVPMITQCPIASFTTFQYKFRASSPGTHLWHAHSNSHLMDGIFGALVVRQPERLEPQMRLYDIDDYKHVLVITEWNRKTLYAKHDDQPVSLLINGRGNSNGFVPMFTVKKGLRYRFRVAYAAGANGCPVEIQVEKHLLKVISLDGHPTVPYEASSVVLGRGERLDFVLKANQISNSYFVKVTSNCRSNKASVNAYLAYNDTDMIQTDDDDLNKIEDDKEIVRVFHTEVCEGKIGKVCINQVQSLLVMPAALRREKVDHKLYLVFDHLLIDKYGSDKQKTKVPRVNNITFTFPSSPLLTQYDDVLPATICNRENTPPRCQGHEMCECVHVEQIPLGSSVELVLIDYGGEEENIFHLHGYSFYVVATRLFNEPMPLTRIQDLDNEGLLFDRNLKSPAYKDTIRIPKNGVVAIRFVANNPGYWMLRDEHAFHWSRGLDIILQVGHRGDFQTVPYDFPKCGNWVGPEFFLV